ncbi:U4/U6.U5 tri-snRNP-associated protein 2-like isoform X2 [Aphidius gifuensis]|uniref:U4/U6.U5 tri-snRNP-associated protein 2-like isoform X2 n=1 Tax=Aphidius gifuensis TaxID=684658 RepID=UPI001CDD1FD4|nr:U4/U6.U5 tri-snRNP-associated protein 2-like isoform X2 [Aphidius gifuensis]
MIVTDQNVHEKKKKVEAPPLCPYLDTINRQLLDFDFEKLCSISLSQINVYACLVCGKYFQGRGTNTYAYTHSVAEGHHVFLNLHTLKFYCLPDNYEIVDHSLNDIKYVFNPTFSEKQIRELDTTSKRSRAIDGTMYSTGIVGMNNIKANDYCNVILQSLSHVTPLRNFFLRKSNCLMVEEPHERLIQRFGELMRKLWNPRNFKAHVSPHEMLQAVVLASNKKFKFTEQGDPIDFLSFFLRSVDLALKKLENPSIIDRTFLGHMRIHKRKIPPLELEESHKRELLNTVEYSETVEEKSFRYLTCDLLPPPLFKDQQTEKIPQVNLYKLLEKFNATTERKYETPKGNLMKRFEITQLPPYLILYIKRFTKNTFFVEKNPTIVNFPIKNLDFGDILTPEVKAKHPCTTYDLVANIVHFSGSAQGTYRVHVLHKGSGQWYELQDLHVTPILPEMIKLSEAYIQIYELQKENSLSDNNDNK